MSSDTLMLTLSSQGVSTVIRELVASGLWLNHHNTGYDKVQLQDVVLQGGFVQGFDEDFSFEVMHTLGELGHAMSPVMCKVDSAMYISSEQVATLLKLALDNGEPTDLYNLASFSAAVELESDFVLEVRCLAVAGCVARVELLHRRVPACCDLDSVVLSCGLVAWICDNTWRVSAVQCNDLSNTSNTMHTSSFSFCCRYCAVPCRLSPACSTSGQSLLVGQWSLLQDRGTAALSTCTTALKRWPTS